MQRKKILLVSYENDYVPIAQLAKRFLDDNNDVLICISDFFGPTTDDFAKRAYLAEGFEESQITDFKIELNAASENAIDPVDYEYLTAIEKKIKINIHQLIFSDYHLSTLYHNRRTTFTPKDKERILKITETILKKCERLLYDFKPDLIFSFGNNHIVKAIIYHLNKLRATPFLALDNNRINNTFSILENFWIGPSKLITYDQQQLVTSSATCKEALVFIDKIREEAQPAYDNEKTFSTTSPYIYSWTTQIIHIFRKFLMLPGYLYVKYLKNIKSLGQRQKYFTEKGFFQILSREYIIKFIITRAFLANKKFNITTLPNKKYIYFPMHLIPENGIFAQPNFTSEFDLIKRLARIIPVDYIIAVKPNPRQILLTGDPYPNYLYRELSELHNVEIMSVTVSSMTLMRNAVAVVSLAGTSLLEAAISGKPAFAYADPEFLSLDGVHKFNESTFSDLLKDANQSVNHSNQKYYIQAIINNSLPLDFVKYGGVSFPMSKTIEYQINFIKPIYRSILKAYEKYCLVVK